MRIDDDTRKSVAFVALRLANGDFQLGGTCVFVNRRRKTLNFIYAVTARHVIEKIIDKGLNTVFLRLNKSDGTLGYIETQAKAWLFHDDATVDLAVVPIVLGNSFDHMTYPIDGLLDEASLAKHEIGMGDEVIIVGLLRHHHGNNRNIPIARVGNISAMPVEKVQTEHCLRDAYLVECRSIGGLSGSPVYTNLGLVRFLDGAVRQSTEGYFHNLLGIVHGHFDVKDSSVDKQDYTRRSPSVNTGIGIVTPSEKLIELLSQEDVLSWEERMTSDTVKTT